MNKDYDFHLIGEEEHELLVLDLVYKNDLVAIINYDKGIENCEIEISAKYEEKLIWTFNFFDFKRAIEKSLELLIKTKDIEGLSMECGENFSLKEIEDEQYQRLAYDMFYKNENFARVTLEKGIEKSEIEILHSETKEVVWNLEVKSFLNALEDAFKKLKG